MRNDYEYRHEAGTEEHFSEYRPTPEDLALAARIDDLKVEDYTGMLSEEESERAAALDQARIDRDADRRRAARLRRGRLPVGGRRRREVKCGGISV